MKIIDGYYQFPGCTRGLDARVTLSDTDTRISIEAADNGALIRHVDEYYQFGDIIAGLPVALILADGAQFIPEDACFRWPRMSTSQRSLAALERHWLSLLLAVLLVPALLYALVKQGIPALADASVDYIPAAAVRAMSTQALYLLDHSQLQDSQLSPQQQASVQRRWQQLIASLEQPSAHYRLHFRDAKLGANAMALPDGRIILTDDLVRLMSDHPEALSAVLLHEIGHIEGQHSLQLIARSTAHTLLFSMLLGNLEGLGEFTLGAGSLLLQNAFSRDMERQADAYAHQQLRRLGLSANHFAEAMALLSKSSHHHHHQGEGEGDNAADQQADQKPSEQHLKAWLSEVLAQGLELFASHPAIEERIERAQRAGADHVGQPQSTDEH